jgi:hypothetical protein
MLEGLGPAGEARLRVGHLESNHGFVLIEDLQAVDAV